jgi:glycosyltransferase involved in cell wall biosynthesis
MKPDITVVIPIFNDWDGIPRLLECLENQCLDGYSKEVLLIDNGSVSLLREMHIPLWASVLVCETPGSYAARNMGVQNAQGRLIAFTDADCLPHPNWLKNGMEAYENACSTKGRRCLIAGGISIEPGSCSDMTSSEVFDVIMGLPQERYVRHGYAVTANLFIPSIAFEEVGLFDQNRFSGGDAEFCRRAGAKGWHLQYCDEAEVVHPARTSWHQLKLKQRRIKGGQLTSGPTSRRLLFAVAAFTPPLRQCFYALSSKKLTLKHRLSACLTQLRLWMVGICEVFRLLVGGKPERR